MISKQEGDWYPNNGEYGFGGLQGNCSWCDYGGPLGIYTTLASNDVSGNGICGQCSTGQGYSNGGRCSVQRMTYNGDPGSCLILFSKSSC